jgi:HK97 family phage prohead protease
MRHIECKNAGRLENRLSAVRRGFKAIDDKPGRIEGYGSVFGVLDDYGDIVARGAFAASLAAWQAKGLMPAMLWQHMQDVPIGAWVEMREDEIGLWCVGDLLLSVPAGAEAYEHVKARTISGLSIGFRTVERTWNYEEDIRTLNVVDLWEVSIVTFPANDSARLRGIKAAAGIKTIRDFEDHLRDAGFSAACAKAIAARGFKAKPDPREEDGKLADLSERFNRAARAIRPKP